MTLLSSFVAYTPACSTGGSKDQPAQTPVVAADEPAKTVDAPEAEDDKSAARPVVEPADAAPQVAGDGASDSGSESPAGADAKVPPLRAQEVPKSILPKGCSDRYSDIEHEPPKDIRWDGAHNFRLGCQRPRRKGWTEVAKAESSGGGTTYVSHAYRKAGWMLLFGEACCSACVEGTLTDCEPWATAHLYPPEDLVDCPKSNVCKDVGLCVQEDGWCSGSEDEWGLSI